jgi:hypothetical protein
MVEKSTPEHAEIAERMAKVTYARNTAGTITKVLESETFSKRLSANELFFVEAYRTKLQEMITSTNYDNLNLSEVIELNKYLQAIIAEVPKLVPPAFMTNSATVQEVRRQLRVDERKAEAQQTAQTAIDLFDSVRANEEISSQFESYILQQLFEYSEELKTMIADEYAIDTNFISGEISEALRYVELTLNGETQDIPSVLQQKGIYVSLDDGKRIAIDTSLQQYVATLEAVKKREDFKLFPQRLQELADNELIVASRLLSERNWNSVHRFKTLREFMKKLEEFVVRREFELDLINSSSELGPTAKVYLAIREKIGNIFAGLASKVKANRTDKK